MAGKKRIYKIIFHNNGKIYELHARQVNPGALLGFVEIGDLIFGNSSSIVVDPAEERLKAEFKGVQRTYIPMQAIVRIDEVEKEGVNKVLSVSGENVAPFPTPFITPQRDPAK